MIPHTLPEIVEAVGESAAHLAHFDIGIRSNLDQLAAQAAHELKEQIDVDISDPETARVAASIALYIVERARLRATVPIPQTVAEYVHTLAGAYDAVNGITSAVAQRHGDAG